MTMRLFFTLFALAGTAYLLVVEKGNRSFAIGALVASALAVLLQMNWISLHIHYARTAIWAAIAACAALLWVREPSKSGATVAAGVVFVSSLTVALSLHLLR